MSEKKALVLSDMIDKAVYTINIDGTVEKWYLEKVLYEESKCFLRKLARPKYHDVRRFFPLSAVFATRREALLYTNTQGTENT